MVINHLLNGMILQVPSIGTEETYPTGPPFTESIGKSLAHKCLNFGEKDISLIVPRRVISNMYRYSCTCMLMFLFSIYIFVF